MNGQERAELARLKDRQMRLEQELSQLAAELNLLEQRLGAPGGNAARLSRLASGEAPARPSGSPHTTGAYTTPRALEYSVPQPSSAQPPAVPPVIQVYRGEQAESPPVAAGAKAAGLQIPTGSAVAAAQQSGPSSSTPVQIPKPPELKFREGGLGSKPPVREAPVRTGIGASPRPGPASTQASGQPAEVRSFEMRLGTYWLVRIGIVMVITGLVFFGNLAYHNYISHLGPVGKVALLYVASATLLGAGWWWQRKAANASLRNYAQVLFAGGWAALYFTTYAAHHIELLRVIQSALLDGILLFACASWMVWFADRKKSEVMALFAVGLAYYTAIITRVGLFTLYSNLVLTVAAVGFLVRHRWAVLSFGSLVATYAAYGFWRFFNGSAWHWASPAEGLWSGTYFLIAYWLVFTSAVFLSRDEKFAGENRSAFLTLNNGAFFTLFLLTMLEVEEGGFWRFALVYGSVLLGLAVLAGRVLSAEPLARHSYLTQGLLLVTVGFISKFAGLQLALILAAESVVLLLMSYQRENMILRVGGYIVAGLAVGWGMDGMRHNDQPGLVLAMGLGALMLVNTMVVHHRTMPDGLVIVRPQPSYFTALALAIWLVATWNNTTRDHFPVILGFEALVLTFSIYLLSIREISLLSQSYLIGAQLAWFWTWVDFSQSQPWWNPALLIAISLGLSHWWQHQQVLQVPSPLRSSWQILYALAIVGTFCCWLSPKVQAPEWLVVSGGLALILTAYGVLTRAWYLAACGQIFVVISALQFGIQLAQAKPAWPFALAPLAVLGLHSWAAVLWFERRPEADSRIREPLLELALVYRWMGLVMSIAWICEYIPARERIWLLIAVGVGIFLWAGARRSREALLFSAPFTVTALTLFWLPLFQAPTVYWPNLAAIVGLLGQRQVAKRAPERYSIGPEVHGAIIVIGGLSLWLFVSRWVLEQASGFYLTASWSLLALAMFTCGIMLRERVYRWLGLGILACALGRVVVFDVWKLETLYRILSFMALGIVLLVLGFIYNKYQEKIREWL